METIQDQKIQSRVKPRIPDHRVAEVEVYALRISDYRKIAPETCAEVPTRFQLRRVRRYRIRQYPRVHYRSVLRLPLRGRPEEQIQGSVEAHRSEHLVRRKAIESRQAPHATV